MVQRVDDLKPSTSSAPSNEQKEVTSKLLRLPKVVLNRIDEQTLLNLKTSVSSKNSKKRVAKVNNEVVKALKGSPKKSNATEVKRSRGRPRKTSNEPISKKNNLKLGVKNKTSSSLNLKSPVARKNILNLRKKDQTLSFSKKPSKVDVKSRGKPARLLNKTILQKRSKVSIPQAKKTKTTPIKPTQVKSPAEAKPTPPKPKLEIIQTQGELGDNSSDSSGDEFLYDELIEELENTANKRVVDDKPVPEKTTITLKPNTGNKPPTVLKGGIVKKTDLPLNLNLFAPSNTNNSNVVTNGLKQTKQTAVPMPGGKRKGSDIFEQSGPAKKSSPWPVSFVTSPKKKSPATNIISHKKKDVTTKVGSSQIAPKPTTNEPPKTTYSIPISSDALSKPSFQSKAITLGMPKAKIGPKQTAKVVPLSKSFDADEYLSDEYLEEETLELDLEADAVPKEPQIKSNVKNSNSSATGRSEVQDTDLDLLKILTDDSDEPVKATSNDAIKNPVGKTLDIQNISREEETITPVSTDTRLHETSEQTKCEENEEAPVRTIYDVMNEVFLEYPSWNLHIIPETSAFCIAQVTKGRLGLPTLKKCIELDPVSYKAKVYIHQYHIKRFDGVYDGEENILALIQEIDSIKA